MDWDALLADLESRFEAERRAEIAAQAADLAEAEIASLRVADRLRGALGRTVRLRTCGGVPVDGVLTRAEDGFVLSRRGTASRRSSRPAHSPSSRLCPAPHLSRTGTDGRLFRPLHANWRAPVRACGR